MADETDTRREHDRGDLPAEHVSGNHGVAGTEHEPSSATADWKDLFREWREDYARRQAEEKLRREGPQPDPQQQPEKDRERGR